MRNGLFLVYLKKFIYVLNSPKTTDKHMPENVFSMKWYIFCIINEQNQIEDKKWNIQQC